MGRLDDRFNEHTLHQRLQSIQDRLGSLSKKKRDEADEQEPRDTLDRLKTVVDLVQAVTAGTDPRLVSPTMLDQVDAQLQQIEVSLEALIENEDFGQLTSIDGACDDLLSQIVTWPLAGRFTKKELQDAAAAFGRAATQRLAQIDEHTEEVADRLREIEEDAAKKREALEEKQTALEGAVAGQQAQVDQLITSAETNFETAEQGRATTFTAAQEELATQAKSLQEELTTQVTTLQEELTTKAGETETDLATRAEAVLTSMKEKEERVGNLVDLVATSATAGAFGKEADEQKVVADDWRANAIKIALGAAGVTVIAVLFAVFVEVSVALIVTKVALSIALLGIAGYAARQSGQHRKREVRARRLYLELTAFSPFTEALNDEDKEKAVREKFIDRLFVGDPQVTDAEVGLTKEDIGLFNQAADVFKRVRGA